MSVGFFEKWRGASSMLALAHAIPWGILHACSTPAAPHFSMELSAGAKHPHGEWHSGGREEYYSLPEGHPSFQEEKTFMRGVKLTGLITSLSVVQARAAFVPSRFFLSRNTVMTLVRQRKNNAGTSSFSSGTPQKPNVPRGGGGGALKAVFFDNEPLWTGYKIIAGANALGFVISLVAPTLHTHVDLLGTGAFAAAALPTLSSGIQRIQWSSAAVVTWSVKLAGFLLFRVLRTGHDSRLDDVLSTPSGAAGFWFISAAWGIVCSLPHALGTTSSAAGNPLLLKAGAVLFGAGFAVETAADYQKWMFKQSHPGQFCNAGLWSLTQHPNWFGNLLLWTGIFVMNAPALVEPATQPGVWHKLWSYRRVAMALLGPAFMWTLFDAQATGKILEESLIKSKERYGYGTDSDYTKYIDSTPLIIPNPFQWFSSSD